jgi:acetyl esterase/lipase
MPEVIRRGLEYSAAPGREPLLLDLYTPDGVARPPLVVWIHGGGFFSGDRVHLPRTLSPGSIFGALTAAGFACASIDYRLAPEVRYPEPVRNVRDAIRFLLEREQRYGYDTGRLGVWGESAGGLLALTAALTIPQVRAVVAWYPVTDVLALPHNPGDQDRESALLGAPAKSVPELAAEASPITHVTESAPPCFLVHGDADGELPVSQSLRMHERLLDVGADSTLRIVPGADHCFENYADIPGLINESVNFLSSRLRR